MGMWPHPIHGQDCSFAVVLSFVPFSLVYIYFMYMDVLSPCVSMLHFVPWVCEYEKRASVPGAEVTDGC